jgi:DNA-binding NtrC family response regulator
LHQRIREGKFREDLFFRLNVIPIRLPALRERNGDVRLLAEHFLRKYSEIDTGTLKSFAPEVIGVLESYRWPGNVRELQNVVRRMGVMAAGTIITLGDVPEELLHDTASGTSATPRALVTPDTGGMTFGEAKRRYLSLFEAAYLRGVLDCHGGNVSRAAEAAEVDRKTFYRLMRKHQLQAASFRGCETIAPRSNGRLEAR